MAEESSRTPAAHDCSNCHSGGCREDSYSGAVVLTAEGDARSRVEIDEYLSTHSILEDQSRNARTECEGCKGIRAPAAGEQRADLCLGPITGEPSCREELYLLSRRLDILPGDVLRYRPLGCPVVHFARVTGYDRGIAAVHLAGPRHLLEDADLHCQDAGVCLVVAFEGSLVWGQVPRVGETVRFLPSHCRMHQVHSGVVVRSEGSKLRIEGIDLKVW